MKRDKRCLMPASCFPSLASARLWPPLFLLRQLDQFGNATTRHFDVTQAQLQLQSRVQSGRRSTCGRPAILDCAKRCITGHQQASIAMNEADSIMMRCELLPPPRARPARFGR